MTEEQILSGYFQLAVAARASGIPEHRTDELKRKADLMALTPQHDTWHEEFAKRQRAISASLSELPGDRLQAAEIPYNNMAAIEREWGRRR